MPPDSTSPALPQPQAAALRYFSPARRADTRERRRQERHLADALAQNRLRLAHAARSSLADGRLLAQEATLHWAAGFRSATPAAAAMATSADPELGRALTRWLLRTGCTAARQHSHVISLPLPPGAHLDLTRTIVAALHESGLSPDRLELRFAEAALSHPDTETLLCLSALRDRGIGLAIDDFGMRTGSLLMLRNLPLSAIRLDPCLTHALNDDATDTAICTAIVDIAQTLDIQVIAHPRDAQHRSALHALGIHAATTHHAPAPLADAA